jgi:c-di-GMP-binding flagellar brake protein YcgR
MIKKLPTGVRQRKRARISVQASYSGRSEEEKPVSGEAMTADVSDSGIGLFSEGELLPGTVLEIECEDLWDSPQKFVVKWSNKIRHNFFRVGLTAGK